MQPRVRCGARWPCPLPRPHRQTASSRCPRHSHLLCSALGTCHALPRLCPGVSLLLDSGMSREHVSGLALPRGMGVCAPPPPGHWARAVDREGHASIPRCHWLVREASRALTAQEISGAWMRMLTVDSWAIERWSLIWLQ